MLEDEPRLIPFSSPRPTASDHIDLTIGAFSEDVVLSVERFHGAGRNTIRLRPGQRRVELSDGTALVFSVASTAAITVNLGKGPSTGSALGT